MTKCAFTGAVIFGTPLAAFAAYFLFQLVRGQLGNVRRVCDGLRDASQGGYAWARRALAALYAGFARVAPGLAAFAVVALAVVGLWYGHAHMRPCGDMASSAPPPKILLTCR